MTRLYLDLGPSFAANISTQRNPLADAITTTLDRQVQRNLKRSGMAPALTLVSSLVTIGGAHAAVFEVENLSDSGPGSLRQAVLDANSNPGPDAITFADGVTGTLTMYNGEMDIYDSLVIQGPGEASLTIDADDSSRIFDIQPNQNGVSAEINDLTLINGYTGIGLRGYFGSDYDGGAIRVGSDGYNPERGPGTYYSRLMLNDVTINNSYASDNGGAVSTGNAFVEITDSTISNNSANGNGGGIHVSEGALTITGSTFDSNYANNGGGGAVSVDGAFSAIIDNTMLTNNYAYGDGGAVYLGNIEVNATIADSTISGNTATRGGGVDAFSFNDGAVLEINNTDIIYNYAGNYGGGVYSDDGDVHIVNNSNISNNYGGEAGGGIRFGSESTSHELRIEDSTIDNNSVGEYGGGIHFYTEDATLLVRNSSISGNSGSYGGGIAIQYDEGAGSHAGSITLDNATIDNNTADVGGGVFWELDETYAPVLITDSSISGNSAQSGDGGGLFLYFDDGLYTSLTIRNTVIDGNYSAVDGGGIWFYDDDGYDVVIENSTISNNSAGDDGGGVWFYSDDGAPIIRNTTISGNDSYGNGGGLYLAHEDGDGRIDNSTIVNNYAYYDGGGLFNEGGSVAIRSSIIANNSVYNGSYGAIAGSDIYVQFSLIENLDNFSLSSNNNNIFYTDPMLGPLADNGGPTMTHTLLAGSPAIDAGLNIAPSADDQRGIGFERMIGLQTDMGAVESDTDAALSFPAYTQLVTNLNDAGAGSLRQAVIDANGSYGLDVIEFQGGLAGTITLTSGDIDIYDSLVINAPVPSVITVSGGFTAPQPLRGEGYDRIFTIRDGGRDRGGPANPSYNLMSVDIVGLTLTNGYDYQGGAIYASDVELTIRDSIITDNLAYGQDGGGGGIFQQQGVLRVLDSTISSNTAQNEGADGGGINISNASLVIRDSYLNSNYANDDGGALHAEPVYSIAVTGTTLDNNQAGDSGGAIDIGSYSYSYISGDTGSTLIADSTISGNTASNYGGGINIYEGGRYGDGLTLDNASITGNYAGGNGGGVNIDDEGRSLFVLNNTSIMNNTAYNDGGGIQFAADNDADTLLVHNSTISNNTAYGSDGGAIFFYSDEAALSIIDSTLNNNSAQSDGGAIAMYIYGASNQPINIINTTISGNTAGESGGGFYLQVYSSGFSGAYLNGPILIEDSIISNNTSYGDGGGLSLEVYETGFYGGVTIRNSTIADNAAQEGGDGGGIFISDDESNYAFVFDNTTVSGNYAGDDGGGLFIYSEDANLFIRNSTFSGNTAASYGGGIAIDYVDDTVFIANSTITDNSAYTGGGIYSNDNDIKVLSSIIAGNTAYDSGDDVYLDGGDADFVFSILSASASNVNDNGFNQFYADPLLAPLADNGGPTETHALMTGSPAINRGFNFVAALTDQRLTGFPRTIGGLTDMGAFEADANPIFSLNVTGSPFAEAGGMATIEAASTEAVGQTTMIDLSFAGVAILDTDFMVDSSTLLIPAGTDMSAGPVTMTGIDDLLFEGDEGIDITGLSNRGPQPPLVGNAIITDDDPEPTVTLSLAGSPINEGGNATVTATLSAVSGLDTTVNISTSGSATPVTDFGLPASIVIPAGMPSADITLTTVDDNLGEIDETVTVDIDSVTNGTEDGVQQVTATILDDDAPDVTLSLVGDPIAENGGISTITATLSNLSDLAVTSNLSFSGTATSGVDFTAPGSIVVPPGMTSADITLTAIDDPDDEGDETAVVDISSVVNGNENGVQQVMTTITDDDGTLVSVSLSVTEVDEGGNADIILTLDETANGDVDIELGFTGSAMMPEDYTVSDTMVTIPAGGTTGTLQIMVNLDLVADPNENIIIDIINVIGGTEDGEQQEILIIRDAPVEVPTLSAVGKWLMMLLLPLAGFLGLRRRRQTK